MPHKVHTFFNAHSIFPTYFQEPKRPSHNISTDNLPARTASLASSSSEDLHEHPAKMSSSSSSKGVFNKILKSAPKIDLKHHAPATISIERESGTCLCHGPPETSTGVLLSAKLVIDVAVESIDIESLYMTLTQKITRKKPFHNHCKECGQYAREMSSWNFFKHPTTLQKGKHAFPFSTTLPGNLPASMDGNLSKIEYNLHPFMVLAQGQEIHYDEILTLKRALKPSERRKAIRIFPPTDLRATLDLPSSVLPLSQQNAILKLEGLVKHDEGSRTQKQWALRRMTWKIEETHKFISHACPKHHAKLIAQKGRDERLAHTKMTDVRTVGSGEEKRGWKTTYTEGSGEVELDFEFKLGINSRPTCDIDLADELEVRHKLIVELIITEEQAPYKVPERATDTGIARILRMEFNIALTEPAGNGIAWDDEMPPVYNEVPPSPPGYNLADSLLIKDFPQFEAENLASPVIAPTSTLRRSRVAGSCAMAGPSSVAGSCPIAGTSAAGCCCPAGCTMGRSSRLPPLPDYEQLPP